MIYGNRQTIVTAHNTTLPDDKLHKRTIGWSVGKVAQDFGTASKIDYLRGVEGRRPHHVPSSFTSLLMRKIETQMNKAIENLENGKQWKSANTMVEMFNDVAFVFLHGNLIAEIGEGFIKLHDGGWQSNTTKSRLNAILSAHGIGGEGVFQKNFEWFIRLWNGTEFVTTEFRSGMRLA